MPKRGTAAEGASGQRLSSSSRGWGSAAPSVRGFVPSRGLHLPKAALGRLKASACALTFSRNQRISRGFGQTRCGATRRAMSVRRRLAQGASPSHPNQRGYRPARHAGRRVARAAKAARTASRKDEYGLTIVFGRREVHGDARSCGVLADLIDCRSAKSRLVGILARSPSGPGIGLTRLGDPLGRPPTVGTRSRRGRREREVVLAWKRGSQSLSASCG